jgi:hypothetical protein
MPRHQSYPERNRDGRGWDMLMKRLAFILGALLALAPVLAAAR